MSTRNIAPRVERRITLAVGAWLIGPVTLIATGVLASVVLYREVLSG